LFVATSIAVLLFGTMGAFTAGGYMLGVRASDRECEVYLSRGDGYDGYLRCAMQKVRVLDTHADAAADRGSSYLVGVYSRRIRTLLDRSAEVALSR